MSTWSAISQRDLNFLVFLIYCEAVSGKHKKQNNTIQKTTNFDGKGDNLNNFHNIIRNLNWLFSGKIYININ